MSTKFFLKFFNKRVICWRIKALKIILNSVISNHFVYIQRCNFSFTDSKRYGRNFFGRNTGFSECFKKPRIFFADYIINNYVWFGFDNFFYYRINALLGKRNIFLADQRSVTSSEEHFYDAINSMLIDII